MIPCDLHRLEIHAAHACNLTCESCSHFSDHGLPGIVTPEKAESWLGPWSRRIAPRFFSVLGGEPTLNPRLSEIVALVSWHFPKSILEVVTNGFYLHKHPELALAMQRSVRSRLVISEHSQEPEYTEHFEKGLALARSWGTWPGFELTVRRYSDEADDLPWTRRHHGYGETMLPYTDGKSWESWQICKAKKCTQLFNGSLWKCPTVAYLPLVKAKFPNLSAAWDLGLGYKSLSPDCTDRELLSFLGKRSEDVCGLCPSTATEFNSHSPLIPARDLKRSL